MSATERTERDLEHGQSLPRVPGEEPGRYLSYLPGLYQSDPFLGRFLRIFEDVLSPVERTVANLPHYFDPTLAPAEMLEWLGSWLAIVVDERWPEERRRELIRSAAALYRWRGTRRGLSELIRLYTGVEPEIDDLSGEGEPFRFRVVLRLQDRAAVDETLLRSVIQIQKPAWAGFELRISVAPQEQSTASGDS